MLKPFSIRVADRFLLVWFCLTLWSAAATAQSTFSFVAIGDMPYGERAVVYPKFEALIGAINAIEPDFTIHVGDIKSGGSECSNEEFLNQFAFMNSFASALVYTPGDNEWTDCHRKNNGAYDPIERLAKLREIFFAAPRSLGRNPIALVRQADAMPQFVTPDQRPYVENARFLHKGVMFVTAHIVGSNNNFEVRDTKAIEEFRARDNANVRWIQDAFARAREENAGALVLAIQADPFDLANSFTNFPGYSGFTASIGETFVPLAAEFGRPVLFVHGDSHVFRIDQPFKDAKGKVIENITRLEVFGAAQMHAVRVDVDPARGRAIWSFQPIFNPADQSAQVRAAK